MSQGLRVLALSVAAASACPAPAAFAQSATARGAVAAAVLAPLYQDDYSYWREQVRVASPSRQARWDTAPRGAVRVYHRRFDARWNWRSEPRHRVVYTYHRGDLWFLDPTTGWAYSIDQYGIVYTADPYRGWVYSLGPLTRWTSDLLYFFELYRFDRGYWYCADYDYFVDRWEDYPRGDYYGYDAAYSSLWDWEPYWRSPTFVSFSINFSTVWVGQVRRHYNYIERNPHYRRELIDSIGLPAVEAVPPHQMSPRAVATSAYWEARDLAAAGFAPPPRSRDRDTGRDWEPGTIVDTREAPPQVVEPGVPAPGFTAPFPDARYGIGSGEGSQKPGDSSVSGEGGRKPDDAPGQPSPKPEDHVKPEQPPAAIDGDSPPQFEEPAYTPQQPPQKPQSDYPKPDGGRGERGRDDGRFDEPRASLPDSTPQHSKPDYEAGPQEQPGGPMESPRKPAYEPAPRYEPPPREEPRWEEPARGEPREEPRYEPPQREEPRWEKPAREEPREEPRYEPPPREEPRWEKPAREEPRDEPRYEPPPREEPRWEKPAREEPRDEPRYEPPQREEPRWEPPAREEPKQEPNEEPREERQEERS